MIAPARIASTYSAASFARIAQRAAEPHEELRGPPERIERRDL